MGAGRCRLRVLKSVKSVFKKFRGLMQGASADDPGAIHAGISATDDGKNRSPSQLEVRVWSACKHSKYNRYATHYCRTTCRVCHTVLHTSVVSPKSPNAFPSEQLILRYFGEDLGFGPQCQGLLRGPTTSARHRHRSSGRMQ